MMDLRLPNGDRLKVVEQWGDDSDLCEAWFTEGDSRAESPIALGAPRKRRMSLWTQLSLTVRQMTAPARRVVLG
jgi:hypothetical protein